MLRRRRPADRLFDEAGNQLWFILKASQQAGVFGEYRMVLAVVAAVVSCPAVDMVMKYEMVVRSL